MGFYYIPAESRVTELDDALYASWVAAGNPKAGYYTPIPDPPGPGYSYDGTEWVAPPPYIPQQITPYQGKAQLLTEGMLSDVEAIVSTSTDPYLKLAWNNAIMWERQSPMIASVAAAMGMTDAEVDDLFVAAAQIQA